MVFEFLANKPICKKDDQSHYFIDYTILEECRGIESDILKAAPSLVSLKFPLESI